MTRKIFKNAYIVDVINRDVFRGWFSVKQGRFEYVEKGRSLRGLSGDTIDLGGKYVVPGLIDAHMHIESSHLTPRRFAQAALRWGTCAVLQDPHEMGNVCGVRGIVFMMRNSQGVPLRIYTAIPSCVPPTNAGVETPNASISIEEIKDLIKNPYVIALGEVMDYNGLLNKNPKLLEILAIARSAHLSIEGHCPSLQGRLLSEYIGYGIRSDHTLTNPSKMEEELRKGMFIMIQPKSLTRENVDFIMTLRERSRILLVTDDVSASSLVEGHLNRVIELAIAQGWDPIDAIASATIRPAEYLGLRDLGAIAPGKSACFFLVDDLRILTPQQVFIEGNALANNFDVETAGSSVLLHSLALERVELSDFRIPGIESGSYRVNVIVTNKDNSMTKLAQTSLTFIQGYPKLESKDIVCIAVFRRGERKPSGCVGFLMGTGLQRGAYASTFAHDLHNLVVIGKKPEEMVDVANKVLQVGGGIAVKDGDRVDVLELPIAGLLTDDPLEQVASKEKALEKSLRSLGVEHKDPLMLFSVLTLSVSPYYKMSDLGIIETETQRLLPVVLGPVN